MARPRRRQEGGTNPWKFAAGSLDSSSNLYKFGTRYYDPSIGRWTQQDPVGGSLAPSADNQYVYANDDPVNLVDLSGALSIGCLAAIIGLGYGFIQAAIGLYAQAQGFLVVAT